MTALRCSVCGEMFDRPERGPGRRRIYCSRKCRERAYRDRADGRIRLFDDPTRPLAAVRPGLRRIVPGQYATRDGGARIVRDWGDAPGWTVVLVIGHTSYVEETYPTLRAARESLGVDVRRREPEPCRRAS